MPRILEPEPGTPFTADALVAACVEGGADVLLLDRAALPDAFFDLGSRLAGELLHGLSKYGIRLAAVVGDCEGRGVVFRDFVREANAGTRYRFFTTRAEALAWVESLAEA